MIAKWGATAGGGTGYAQGAFWGAVTLGRFVPGRSQRRKSLGGKAEGKGFAVERSETFEPA